MAKDRVEKKDKREKKEKRSEKDGVSKSKKDKKEKKDRSSLTEAVEQELTTKVLDGIESAVAAVAPVAEADGMDIDARPVGALVPFAQPLVEDKSAKKVLKSVKKGKLRYRFDSSSECWRTLRLFSARVDSCFTSYCLPFVLSCKASTSFQ
jgi:H/ACA ribonucleoprotein complex subunit 2